MLTFMLVEQGFIGRGPAGILAEGWLAMTAGRLIMHIPFQILTI